MRIKMTEIINRRGIKLFLFLAVSGLVSNCSKDKDEATNAPVSAAVKTEAKAGENAKESAAPSLSAAEEKKQIAKLFGYDVGKRLSTLLGPEDLDTPTFINSFKDAFSGKGEELSEKEVEQISALVRAKMEAKQKKLAEENQVKGKTFLEENKKKEGVKSTESGIQYKILKEGKGEKPGKEAKVSVHYEGKLIDGTVFDSSYKRGEPVDFPLNRVIPGWTEIIQLMPVGSTWEVTIPSELAYGSQARPTIPANSTLIFKIELLSIVKEEVKPEKSKASKAKKVTLKKVEPKKEEVVAEKKEDAPKRNIKAKLTVENS